MEIARQLSRSRRLVLGGRDHARLQRTRQACEKPDNHVEWAFDLADISGIESSLLAKMRESKVQIDSFVHCAGVLKLMRMRTMELSGAMETMNVNFLSAAEIVKLLLRKPVNDHQLRGVIFVSSTASQFGARGFNMYCASKGALDALMRALAVELAPEVRVNSVLPGAVKTEMTASMFADSTLSEKMAKDYPLGIGEPSDIAAAVSFLLSSEARWITGQQIVVDGGRTINITA